jgi:hypothetical protein
MLMYTHGSRVDTASNTADHLLHCPCRSIRQLKKDIKAQYVKQSTVRGLTEDGDDVTEVLAIIAAGGVIHRLLL